MERFGLGCLNEGLIQKGVDDTPQVAEQMANLN